MADSFKKSPSSLYRLLSNFNAVSLIGIAIGLMVLSSFRQPQKPFADYSNSGGDFPGTGSLVMEGGDPYLRALMRTITASEANVDRPYHVLYGGQYVRDLRRHPEHCVTIVAGPNQGNCSTAAGRYQFINTTWYEKAKHYHPQPGFWWQRSYSFEPKYQDAVVYAWLGDRAAWGVDIPQLLRQGKINQVLRHLSGTWTSLGYGIETNANTHHLPQIYQKLLHEELEQSG